MASEVSRVCPFNNFPEFPCPAEDVDYFAMRETCDPGEYGRKCGPVVMQKILLDTIDIKDLNSTLDKEYGLIDGFVYIDKTPTGDLPESVRESTVGIKYPLRASRPIDEGKVLVTHADLTLTLLRERNVAAANAYGSYLFNAALVGLESEWWNFRSDEVVVSGRSEAVSTMDHYDDSFRLSSPVVWNSASPYFMLARIANVDFRPSVQDLLTAPTGMDGRSSSHDTYPGRRVEDVQLPE